MLAIRGGDLVGILFSRSSVMGMYKKLAIATLLYSADYLPGVFALGHQVNKLLEEAGKKGDIETCLIVTTSLFNDTLSELAKNILQSIYTKIVLVEPLDCQEESIQKNSENLALLERPELSFALIKARLWELTQFEQVLYLDSDTLPLNKEFLKLFDIMSKQTTSQVGAIADIGWPDMFNSGVMMLIPDADTASVLQNYIIENTSIDGSDQGILNQFFNQNCCTDELVKDSFSREWVQLSFTYNVTVPNLGYQSSPAMNYFKPSIKLIHFIGKHKPWSLWSQKNFIKNEYHDQWNEVYEEFKEEHQLNNEVSKPKINDSDKTETPETITPVDAPPSNEPTTNQEIDTISTVEENVDNQNAEPVPNSDHSPAPNPVPLDFTKWLTTFINKDHLTNQPVNESREYSKENDNNIINSSSNRDQESPPNSTQEPNSSYSVVSTQADSDEHQNAEEEDSTTDNASNSGEESHLDDISTAASSNNNVSNQPNNKNFSNSKENNISVEPSPSNPEQKRSTANIQKPSVSTNDLPDDVEPHTSVDDNIQYLEKDKEGYEEFLPDVYESNAIDNEEEFFDDDARDATEGETKTSAVADKQEDMKLTAEETNQPQQEMPNFKFDWEDSDYLSKVERCFPDDIFEYAVE